jgi:hypothetical protein
MTFIEHGSGREKVVEIDTGEVIINSEQDILDLIANVDYQFQSRKIVLHRENLCEGFYDLSSGIAGSIMQKFSNYRVRAAITGDFSNESKHFKAFMSECNRTGQVLFSDNLSHVLHKLML